MAASALSVVLKRVYLAVYNWTVFTGWSLALYLALKTLKETGYGHVYKSVEKPLQLAQSAAVLEQTQTHILVSTLVFSWSITEVVRYSFFGTKEALGFAPSWLLWLRYSTFFLLHPIGVTSEIGLIYIALPDIKESEKYSIKMPNKWNFSFYFFYAAIFTIGIFSIGSFFMFQHLCRQRNKALSKPKIV
ncbi:very-long-chain (3R)-3-hydroxyacyl-CoA dehydratase PASTICCINO 2 isoform X5 [Ziziphus jujuba]|uniref:Very-long-chain (3R)-3-hydroxyacyl-CoA dehydratase n=1 Tax=Ziziphus jujuba TaxID=326968 RepID=A0ABM3IUI2_ZIZJJ|nr:very-long-chain (3R)-3-hydroxyacyl-CoA dehydratase PASTICCINO 2 isoform X5 [Ziziphus jujuba]